MYGKFMIPSRADQPTNSFSNASKPAAFAYGTDDIYGMRRLQDVDNTSLRETAATELLAS
ncbi:hypothetical protein [Streptomyces sp. DSM 118878]